MSAERIVESSTSPGPTGSRPEPAPESPLDPASLRYDERGLLPAIAQAHDTGAVLMQAWMTEATLRETLATGRVVYWSRRRGRWPKGETSGHVQRLVAARADCDRDCVLLLVEQTGPACHTGAPNCFFHSLATPPAAAGPPAAPGP